MKKKFTFKPVCSRRIPDPNFYETENKTVKHIFIVPCKLVPSDLSNEPNARTPNIKRTIYKEIGESLISDDGMFHLKNRGITIIADSITQKDNNEYEVSMDTTRDGIVDGGHTYALIQHHKDETPDNQFVQIEIRVGIEDSWIIDIAGGLNTSVQVQDMSLDHLSGKFEWLKKTLKEKKKYIAWTENEVGKYIDARDLVSIMCLFNVGLFQETNHPIIAYSSKAKALKKYEDEIETFEMLEPILLDILYLYDYISFTAKEVWNSGDEKTKGGKLHLIDNKKRGNHVFEFIDKESPARLHKPALYAILAAFRVFVDINNQKKLCWITDDFSKIKDFWHEHGRELLKATYQTSQELKYNLTTLGKSPNLWTTLYSMVNAKAYASGIKKYKS